uniref:Uncharacterized protein n=1 Tax=Candidatus Methanophagaceae archaeon ANME-1 ERB6 TaxID=2759912 RepID=A0A7G9YTT3_9EURY|nr:hypothetical protein PFCPEAIJ_00019 [Methanosarcinales archaeon ANME-1 ERB6]
MCKRTRVRIYYVRRNAHFGAQNIKVRRLLLKRGEKIEYQPFKEQKFWGDTWAMVLARIMGTTHEEEKVLGRPETQALMILP